MITTPRPDQTTRPLISRRTLLIVLAAAGLLAPFTGIGTAHASSHEAGRREIPDEAGCIPWW